MYKSIKLNLMLTVLIVNCLSPVMADDFFLYKSRKGDNLWDITSKQLLDISYWEPLKKLNNLPNADEIVPGTIIKIPREWLTKQNSSANIIYTIGKVEITPPLSAKIRLLPVKDEAESVSVVEGTKVETGSDGLATIAFADESKLLLQNNSSLILEGLSRLGDGSLVDTHVRLEQGHIENRVNPNDKNMTNYEVTTPFATTSVRGTEFRVNADKQGKTIAEVLKGQVEVGNKKESKLVQKGSGAIIDGLSSSVIVQTLPATIDPKSLPILIERSPINIDVPQQSNITGYRVKIIEAKGSLDKPVSDKISKNNKIVGNDIPDGRYKMYISALNNNGLEGETLEHDFVLNARPLPPLLINPQIKDVVTDLKSAFKWARVNTDVSTSYHLQVAKDSKFEHIVIDQPNLKKNEWGSDDINLENGEYFWRILVTDNGDKGPFSDASPFKYLANNTKFNSHQIDKERGISLSWQNAGKNYKYRIQVSENKDFDNIVYNKLVAENQLTIELFKSGIFYVRIQIIDEDGNESKWSHPYSIVIKP